MCSKASDDDSNTLPTSFVSMELCMVILFSYTVLVSLILAQPFYMLIQIFVLYAAAGAMDVNNNVYKYIY